MQTATQARLMLDVKLNRARQYATMIVHELSEGGYLPSRCLGEAREHLTDIFYREDVEITTAEQRKIAVLR